MSDKLTRRGFLASLAAAAASPAFAQGFQQNQRGTNILIQFKSGYEEIANAFSNPTNAAYLANALIEAERKRTRRGGDPDNNRPNSSEYEKVLTSALRGLKVNGQKIGDIATVLTEENEAQHMCATRRGDGRIAIRFTSTGPGRDYEKNLSARVSAAGVDTEHGVVNFAASPKSGCQYTPGQPG